MDAVFQDELVQGPAIGVLGAAVVAAVMFLPRWSVGLSWALVVLSIFIGPMFGPSLGLATWLLDLSPLHPRAQCQPPWPSPSHHCWGSASPVRCLPASESSGSAAGTSPSLA
jgi:hypothetical protein